jgi:hypothetical protein
LIENARELNLHTSAYILSMVLEVSEADKEHDEENRGGAAPQFLPKWTGS